MSQQRTELEAALLARKTKQIELLARVKVFLDAISRNSIKSKRSYSSGLTLLQNFLNNKAQQQKYQKQEQIDTLKKLGKRIELIEERGGGEEQQTINGVF